MSFRFLKCRFFFLAIRIFGLVEVDTNKKAIVARESGKVRDKNIKTNVEYDKEKLRHVKTENNRNEDTAF